jgi:hypothetical protein
MVHPPARDQGARGLLVGAILRAEHQQNIMMKTLAVDKAAAEELRRARHHPRLNDAGDLKIQFSGIEIHCGPDVVDLDGEMIEAREFGRGIGHDRSL